MSQYLLHNADINHNPTLSPNVSHALKPYVHTSSKSPNPSQTRSTPIHRIHTPTPHPRQVQTEFMDAMTSAIIRFLDKHEDHTKSTAEQSVFVALGYDLSIESETHGMAQSLSHYRRHHIMRNRDAIRTFRIKKLHQNIMKQHPNYSNDDVLKHLTSKLNCIYLPSPSPPPITHTESTHETTKTTPNIECNELKTRGANEEEQQTISVQSKSTTHDAEEEKKYITRVDHIQMDTSRTKIKNINYTINNACASNRMQSQKTLSMTRAKKQSVNREVSPSQTYTNKIKYKKKKKGYKNKKKLISLSVHELAQNAYHYPSTNSYLQTPHAHATNAPFYMMDDEVTQKIKLHKKSKSKSRKRKFTFNEFEDPQLPPAKKRARKDLIHHRKGRGRAISMNKNRARRVKNRNQYEEDETSDIDSNYDPSTSQTTNSHI
eukprot:509553_1